MDGWVTLLPGPAATAHELLAPPSRRDLTVAVLRVRGPSGGTSRRRRGGSTRQSGCGPGYGGAEGAADAPGGLLPGLTVGDTSRFPAEGEADFWPAGSATCWRCPAGSAQGDPEVTFLEDGSEVDEAFALLVDVVRQLQASGARPQLSGLKDQLRKRRPGFSEKRYGFNTFLSFAKAAQARNLVGMAWDQTTNEYLLQVPD